MKTIKDKILFLLYTNINKKFSVSEIWEEFNREKEIPYTKIQVAVLELEWKKEINIEWKHPYKLVWVGRKINKCFCNGDKDFKKICTECKEKKKNG